MSDSDKRNKAVGVDAGAAASSRTESQRAGSSVGLDALREVPVTISLELGRTQLSIGELLQLNPGSVVELDRLAGEPLDVRVNGTLIARGEVVVVDERYGIRLTEVLSGAAHLQQPR
ncbi:MAG: flagellar motor switch protein FliN [Pseudomonadota bacterium]|nr:MAG: flagellar motor switch protein FliN [Pseudomonadota bacterium]